MVQGWGCPRLLRCGSHGKGMLGGLVEESPPFLHATDLTLAVEPVVSTQSQRNTVKARAEHLHATGV